MSGRAFISWMEGSRPCWCLNWCSQALISALSLDTSIGMREGRSREQGETPGTRLSRPRGVTWGIQWDAGVIECCCVLCWDGSGVCPPTATATAKQPVPRWFPPPTHPTVLRATMYGRPTSEYIYSRPLQQSASPPHDERSHTTQIYAYPAHPSLYHPSQQELDSAYYPQDPQLHSPPAIYGPPLVQQQMSPIAHQRSMQYRSIPANFVDDPAFSSDPHANPLTQYPTFAMNSREEIVPMGNQVSIRFLLGPFYLCTLAPTLLSLLHLWPSAHLTSLL